MRITAALCWWNELPEELARAVSSVSCVADKVVALDGAYKRYPGGTPRSNEDQVEAIIGAADAAGMDSLVIQPRRLWVGQVEKRSYLLSLAALKSDWILILDADYIITADKSSVIDQLSKTDHDTLEVEMTTPVGEYATNWHKQQAGPPSWHPLVFRALPGMHVEDRHWWYTAVKDGRRVWIWDGDSRYPTIPRGRLFDYRVEHRTTLQNHEATMAARAWYNDVDMITKLTGQEDDVPGLPEPVYDIERVPF